MKLINRLILSVSIFLFCGSTIVAQDVVNALIPIPYKVEVRKGAFKFKEEMNVCCNDKSLDFAFTKLQEVVAKLGMIQLKQTTRQAPIQLLLDEQIQTDEHYFIDISKKRIVIRGKTAKAVLYGVMTFKQLLMGDIGTFKKGKITALHLEDKPRFSVRALMIDPARHFLSKKDILFYLDQMVKYKLNRLQLHLTDNEGWRIEIKAYPQLTSKGAFYTQEDLKEIVTYAAQRGIEIIPEIDVPGHTAAILTAFPELNCQVGHSLKKTEKCLCASHEKVYTVLKTIIHEVAAVFPASQIHLGGDEAVIDKTWGKCKRCQQKMKQLDYAKPADLMSYFFGKVLTFVQNEGKQPILWCELDRVSLPVNSFLFDYPKNVQLVTWRNGLTPKCLEFCLKTKHQLLMAPGEYAYFDYPQYKNDFPEFNNWGMPITTLRKSYDFDPGYGVNKVDEKIIQGVMGTLWGEAISDINRLNYMTFPRALSLSEAGWSMQENRSWESFKQRLFPNLAQLMKEGVSLRVPFEIVK